MKPASLTKEKSTRAHGFTLLEVLIALGIVSVIAILSWRGLDEVIDMAKRLNRVDAQLQEVTAIFGQLDKDISAVENQLSKGLVHVPDSVVMDETGLTIVSTERQQGRQTYQRQILWQQTPAGLIRSARVLEDSNDVVTRSEPLPVRAMRIRLWADGVGFNGVQNFGEVGELNQGFPNYQGKPNPLKPTSATPNENQGGANNGANADGDNPAGQTGGITRAVEVTLTLQDGRSVTRFLPLGGLR